MAGALTREEEELFCMWEFVHVLFALSVDSLVLLSFPSSSFIYSWFIFFFTFFSSFLVFSASFLTLPAHMYLLSVAVQISLVITKIRR